MTTQQILYSPGTPTTFAPSGSGDVIWTPQSVALANGRLSSVWDRGAGHLPLPYVWRAKCRWVATPSIYDSWRLWLVTADAAADAAVTDGGLTLGDATLTSESSLLASCHALGAVVAIATDQLFVASGVVQLTSRYIAVAGWNASATKALTATAGDFSISFTPIPSTIQAPA